MSPRVDIAAVIASEAESDARRLLSPGRWAAVDAHARLALILGRAWPYMLTRCECMEADEILQLMADIQAHARASVGVALPGSRVEVGP